MSLLAGFGAPSWATEDEPGQPLTVELARPSELESGSMAIVEGSVDGEGVALALPDLTLMQPVGLWLSSTDPGRPVVVEVTKFGHEGAIRRATAAGDRLAEVLFRTELGVGLRVRAEDSIGLSPFQLIVWVGDEVQEVPDNVFAAAVTTPKGTKRSRGRGVPAGIVPVVLGGAALVGLAALAVALALRVFRRPGVPRGVSATLILLSTMVWASSSAEAKGWAKLLAPMSYPDAQIKGGTKAIDFLKKVGKAGTSGSALPEGFDPLTKDDVVFADCYSAASAPRVASQCAAGEACGRCFEEAYENLNRQRFRLCKLNRIYTSMMRMGKGALAFGDDASAVHGVAGLGWQLQGRKPIEESMASFQSTCRDKYEEIIGELQGALQQVGACEQEFYDTPDWYGRFGALYFDFLSDRYRPDAY